MWMALEINAIASLNTLKDTQRCVTVLLTLTLFFGQGFSAGLRLRARHAGQYVSAAKSAANVLSAQRGMEKEAKKMEKVGGATWQPAASSWYRGTTSSLAMRPSHAPHCLPASGAGKEATGTVGDVTGRRRHGGH